MNHKITDNGYKQFRHYVKKSQALLGLNHIKIRVTKEDIADMEANAAFVYDHDASNLFISLNASGIEKTFATLEEDLAYNAFHEVCEGGFLGPMTAIIERYTPRVEIPEVENQCHRIVNMMWYLLKERVMK